MEGEHLSYLKKTTSGERLEFAVSDAASFQGHGTSAFWSGAEKGELTLSIMERVVVDPAKLSPLLPSTLNEKKKSAILALPSLMHSLQHAGLVEPFLCTTSGASTRAKSMYSSTPPRRAIYCWCVHKISSGLRCSSLSPPTPHHPPGDISYSRTAGTPPPPFLVAYPPGGNALYRGAVERLSSITRNTGQRRPRTPAVWIMESVILAYRGYRTVAVSVRFPF